MFSNYDLKFPKEPQGFPLVDFVSAVFMVAFNGDLILACRNERGWDIPGGHVEKGETLESAIRREVLEEAGATVGSPTPYAVLSLPNAKKSMLFYVSTDIKMGDFTPKDDVFERKLMSEDELLRLYHGNPLLLRAILKRAKELRSEH